MRKVWLKSARRWNEKDGGKVWRARISMFTVLNPNRGAQGHSDWKFNLKIGELFRYFFSLDEHIDTMHVPCYAFVFTFR